MRFFRVFFESILSPVTRFSGSPVYDTRASRNSARAEVCYLTRTFVAATFVNVRSFSHRLAAIRGERRFVIYSHGNIQACWLLRGQLYYMAQVYKTRVLFRSSDHRSCPNDRRFPGSAPCNRHRLRERSEIIVILIVLNMIRRIRCISDDRRRLRHDRPTIDRLVRVRTERARARARSNTKTRF